MKEKRKINTLNMSQQLYTYIKASRHRSINENSHTCDVRQNSEFFENSPAKNLLLSLGMTRYGDNCVYTGMNLA